MNEWMNEWMNELGEWVNGWMDEWMDETIFSCLKRTFGREYVYSKVRLKKYDTGNYFKSIVL